MLTNIVMKFLFESQHISLLKQSENCLSCNDPSLCFAIIFFLFPPIKMGRISSLPDSADGAAKKGQSQDKDNFANKRTQTNNANF